MTSPSEPTFEESTAAFMQFMQDAMQGTRTAEILLSAMTTMQPIMPALKRVVDADPELRPEIQVALDHLIETVATLQRAADFVKTRYEVAQERFQAVMKPTSPPSPAPDSLI